MKASSTNSIDQHFFRGNYREVLDLSVNTPSAKIEIKNFGWVIGALCFLGRLDEAAALFHSRSKPLPLRERIQSRFFLGIGYSRKSRYEDSRHLFGLNLREKNISKKELSGEMLFFIYQGLSFNRYFTGRYRAAAWASARAHSASIAGGFLYGKTLAADIRGHILVHSGEVPAGLALLEQAREHAERLGNRSVSDAIQISILGYRAEFGMEPKKCVKTLTNALKKLTPQDNYSKSGLLLELARQQMLRARLKEASATLDEAGETIYATQNRRHEVLLNLRNSYLFWLSGESARGLSFIRSAKKSLDPAVDHALELSVLGMECKLLRDLGKTELADAVSKRVEPLSLIYGGRPQRRMTERENQVAPAEFRKGLDPLGQLLDDLTVSDTEGDLGASVDHILDQGYHSFLYESLKLSRASQTIYFELLPGAVTLFDRGSVQHFEGLSPLLKSLATQISRGDGSKQALIEKIWGYTYHPLRHDAVIYSAITSLRKLLGENSRWLEMTEKGYTFAPGIIVRFNTAPVLTAQVAPSPKDSKNSPAATHEVANSQVNAAVSESVVTNRANESINLRQIKILRYLGKNESIDARTCRTLFKISEITATRDLSALNQSNLVVKVGRGRATQYVLPSKNFVQQRK